QTHTAIQEQRVVAVPGVVRHLPGRRTGQLVGLALDKVLESEAAVQIAGVLDDRAALIGTLGRLRLILLDPGVIGRLRLKTESALIADSAADSFGLRRSGTCRFGSSRLGSR